MPANIEVLVMPNVFNVADNDQYEELDLQGLMVVILNCFKLNRDARQTDDMRDLYLEKGKELRMRLDRLTSAYFVKGVSAVQVANAEIHKTNESTKRSLIDIDEDADLIGQLGALASALDGVIKLLV